MNIMNHVYTNGELANHVGQPLHGHYYSVCMDKDPMGAKARVLFYSQVCWNIVNMVQDLLNLAKCTLGVAVTVIKLLKHVTWGVTYF